MNEECTWNGCVEPAARSVALDYGEEVCEACGTSRTKRMDFSLCVTHWDQYVANNQDSNVLIINATGVMA